MVSSRVYIVNLDEKVDERILYEIMVQAGPLVSLSIPKIKNSKLHRGYGFAEYTTAESAEYAVKLFSGLVSLYGKRLGFKISGTKNNWATVINQEAHGLLHKYQFTPSTLKSCVGYRMPFILPSPHWAAPSAQIGNAKRKSRFKSNSSAITVVKQPKSKRRATDRRNSSEAIEIQPRTS